MVRAIPTAPSGPPPLARGERGGRRRRRPAAGTTPARAGRTSSSSPPPPRRTDHPRSRGENKEMNGFVKVMTGPPPLARGERGRLRIHRRRCRTTPARAGRTDGGAMMESAEADHPRSRGENGAGVPASRAARGPPPPARGEPLRGQRPIRTERTTPARAGRTPRCPSPASPPPDHPRSRGENSSSDTTISLRDGPPPLARGEPLTRRGHRLTGRTTPARAGRTGSSAARRRNCPDHPRSRGENPEMPRPRANAAGPPPLARGELAPLDEHEREPRTTPARAGRTGSVPSGPRSPADHPRSRGENARGSRRAPSRDGPPPLARGERGDDQGGGAARRTTPARAGRTSRPGAAGRPATDHPRSRGENQLRHGHQAVRHGPPPLARGELQGAIQALVPGRTTPARAGRTDDQDVGHEVGPDHPRSRGENGRAAGRALPPRGPPPLARGEPLPGRPGQARRRTTPARAGRTTTGRHICRSSADHPRSRGENAPPIDRYSAAFGPPPLARGERPGLRHRARRCRTTPARAGRTVATSLATIRLRDHPRSRGENVA